jgi:flagellar assembly factor FliW
VRLPRASSFLPTAAAPSAAVEPSSARARARHGVWERTVIKLKTTRFGDIEVRAEDVIELPAGLIGFPELKRYVLLDHDKDSPFKWLQSLDDGAIAFVLINPLLFKPDYTVEVTEAEVLDLSLTAEEDAVISVIITIPNNPQNMTANLKAPLVFNLKNRRGKQLVLSNSQYTTRHNIMEEIKKQTQAVQAGEVQDAIERAKVDSDEARAKKGRAAGEP